MKYLVKQNWLILSVLAVVLFTGVILTSCKHTETKRDRNEWLEHRGNRFDK